MKKRSHTTIRKPQIDSSHYFEAEVIEGLETIACEEIEQRISSATIHLSHLKNGLVQFEYNGDIQNLKHLKSCIAIYRVLHFPIPRPKALLGHQHFTMLIHHINGICKVEPNAYHTFTISAAGSESSVMKRIQAEIAAATGLHYANDSGDLLIRLRRPINQQGGWEVLLRLSPRPLSVRDYRVVDYPGAVNSTVAYAIAKLLQPNPSQTMLNIACGSGTILMEYSQLVPTAPVIGCDIDPQALAIAAGNIRAGGHSNNIQLLHADAQVLPFSSQSIDVLCADLPFGHLVGTHTNNQTLYPAVLAEAARVAYHDARFIILSHEIKLMEKLLRNNAYWKLEDILPINLRGLHPRLFILRRK